MYLFKAKQGWYYVPIFIGICLYLYIIIRAYTVPMTHDEVNTCIIYARQSFWDIVNYADPIPNNHIFHTLWVKLSEMLFGISQITVRIPNLLAFSIYLFSAIAFMRYCTENNYIRAFAFCALLLNPFLIDFFSLARGYALSIDFMLAACLAAFYHLQQPQTRYLTAAVVLSILSPYSNFTTLNFYAPFTGLLLLFTIQESIALKNKTEKIQRLLKHGGIILGGAIVLAAISYTPIRKMMATDQFRFWGGSGFYEDTLKSLTYMCLDGQAYIHKLETTVVVFSIFIVIFLGVLYAALSINLWNKKAQLLRNPFAFFGLLLFGAIASVIVQFHLLGTPYVNTRTALFYYPLFMLAIIFFLIQLTKLFPNSSKRFVFPLTLFVILHFARTVNLKTASEWWYNQDDKKVLAYIEQQYLNTHRTEPITLNADWAFIPTLIFYDQIDSLQWVSVTPWHMDIDTTGTYEYYYVESKNVEALQHQYEPVLSFEWNGRVLLKRK